MPSSWAWPCCPATPKSGSVLLSDGQQNEGDARAAADLVAARQVVLDVLPLGGGVSGPEVQVTSLDAPDAVPLGQRFELAVRLDATAATRVRLRVFGDSRLLFDQMVEVPEGGTSYRVPIEAGEEGFRRYRAVIEGEADTRPQNNEAAAYTEVTGQPRVALVTSNPEEVSALLPALEAARMSVTVLAPETLPQSLPELVQYDSIVLVGVEAPEIPPATMAVLPTFVREWGHGLVMIGGPEGFGAGQWLRTPVEEALPVDMEVRPRDQEANVALVLAVDKSGSMGRCHCDDPDNAQQQGQRLESGLPKVDIAKDAIVQATNALGQMDFVGVVAFDSAARWALETQRFPGLASLEQAIAPIDANGETNIFAGLTAAQQSLSAVDARVKHIILLTDGWSRAGDHQLLADQLAEEGITLSVVAAGAGSAQDLAMLADAGGGAYYPAASMEDIPQIFLKETIRISGRYIIEEPFYPTLMGGNSSILAGLPLEQGVPPLIGYNGSTIKADATEIMRTPQGDPLLATRRYGIGRTVAWTSDLSGRWAGEWLTWGGYPAFASQLVGWSFPDPQSGDLQVRTRQEGGATFLEVTSLDEEGRPVSATDTRAIIVSPELESTELTVPQVGAGRYRAELPVDAIGAYLVNVTQTDESGEPLARSARGFVVPYSPEYRLQQADETLLTQLAARTGGIARTLDAPEAVFVHPPQQVTKAQALWPWLLGLALLLFPFDVAVRRVLFGQREWEAARAWLAARRAGGAAPLPADEPVLGTLFEAKQRGGRRRTMDDGGRPAVGGAPVTPAPAPAAPRPESRDEGGAPPPAEASDEPDADTLSRLRGAKRRARR